MEIATPTRSSPFPKLTFDHKLIIAKHLVSTNDEKRKTPNHLIGDESSTCDLKDQNYENGAKTRLNETKIIGGAKPKTIEKTTVGIKPIIVQRQDDMPSKMSENHFNGAALMMTMNGDDLCNSNNNNVNNRDNTISNIKLSYDVHKSLDEKSNTSVKVHDDYGLNHDELNHNCNININSNGDNYNENFIKSTSTSEGRVSSSGTLNSGISVSNKKTTFKVPEFAVSNSHSGSPSPSPSAPYRKQSVFVAPAGLNWIIHKSNRNNQQQQQQPLQHVRQISNKHNLIDSSEVSTLPETVTTSLSTMVCSPSSYQCIPTSSFYSSSSAQSSSLSTTSSSASSRSTSSTLYASSIEINGETLSNNSSSSLIGNNNSSKSVNNSSSSSNFTANRKNSTGLQPKANAQEIEQHISKIISENAAIVETLDPLWSKRYLSRHSVSSLPSGSTSPYPTTSASTSTTHSINSLPSRRYSEIVVDPNHVSGSKLQSALLGRILTTSSLTSGTTVVTPSNVPHVHQHSTLSGYPGPTKKFSEPNYPSVIINMKQQQQQALQKSNAINKVSNTSTSGTVGIGSQSSDSHETGLEPSLVRNLLTSSKSPATVRVIPVPVSSSSSSSLPSTSISSQISTVTGSPIAGLTLSSIHRNNNSSTSTTAETILVDNSFSANLENPEGSIIKDLLLKARDSNSETNERKNSRANLIPPIQEELSMLVYVCTLCKIAFRNKETLEAHQLHYCKANETQSTINEFSPNQLQLLNDHVQRKISVMESNFLQQQLTKPVQSSICPNPKQLGSSTNVFSQPQNVNIINKQHHYQSTSNQSLHQQNQPIVGNILKQQLLAPSAGPPMKKRKTSEPLFAKSYLRQNHNNANSHHQLNHNQQYSTTATTTNESNSHFVRKTSVVQSPPSKLLHIGGNKSNTKEGLIESDCLNNISGLSPSVALSSSNVVNDDTSSSNHVISNLNEPMAFSSTNIVITQSGPFSSANQHNFINQSSLDRLSIANQSTKPLDILPDYYPHLKCPETKVTLTGPIVFSVLRKILLENKENVEFQASPEALHTSESSPPFTLSSTSTSSSSSLPSTLTVAATTTSASTINSSDQATKDVISTTTANSSYLVYKQIPSIPEFDEDEMEEKVDDKMIISSIKNEDTPSSGDGGICKNKRSNFTDQYPIKMDGKSSQQQCINPIENEETGQKDEKGENEAVEMKQQQHQPPTEECKPITNESNRKFDSKINGVNISNRPTSLKIRKRSLTNVFNKLIGSTLVSPDTPRPKRKCMQLYMKGQTYTYLNLKMSTRSTYCCIYRPQPMYVPQEAQSKLSMYSNWQIISPHDDIFKLISPSELFHAYDTRQWCYRSDGVKVTFAPSSESKKSLNDSFILTPSTYWTIKKSAEEKANIKREIMELKRKGVEDLTDLMEKSVINMNNNNNCRKTSEDRLSTMSGFDSDSNDPNQPKRVKIFEGGFKSNEDYTYVRGRGRGKYVCEECGIRCKKPSMLKKHIRTHTDLRPYSCRHCAFAFKTKGNLTKHMKSKAHHKKCVELGIIPVPITIDESQIDCDALAKQEALERSYSGGHLASDDDENDPDDEDGCEEEEDDGSDDEGVPIPIITSSGVITTDHRKMDVDGGSEERKEREHRQSIIVANEVDEQEVARSLLVLSGSGEWSVGSNPAAVAAAIAASASGVTVASNCLEAHYSDIPRTTASSPTSKQQHIEMISDLRKISQSSSSSSIATTSSSLSINKSSADERSPTVNSGPSHYVNNLENWTPSITSFNHSRQRSFSFNDGLIRRNQNNHHHPSMVPNLDNLRRFERQTATFTPNNFCLSNEAANATSTSSATPIIEPISTDDDNDSEIEDHFQRRYSMSVIQDRYNEPFYLNSEGPIDLSKRQEENDSANAGPSSRYDQTLPGRRNTLSTPSAAAHHLSRAELAAAINGSSIGITREDGKSVCRKCNKTFRELSQLRLHVNVHYLERPFRCESCGVSFRTKGHLQKHEKSVTHSDKVRINLSFGTPTTENPRPFRCDDCNTAFRIHGHLAKHLRSKNHIMKLECAGKLPCGMYADMERFNINLNVIETADCENSLISLQKLAEKMYAKNGEVDLSWLRQSTSNGNNINCSNQPNPAPTALTSTSAPAAPFITTVNGMNHNSEPNMNISNNYDPNLTNVNNDYNNNNSSNNIVINSITAVNNNIEVNNNNHNTNFHYNSVNNTPSSLPSPLSIASSTYPASSTSSTPSSSVIPPPPPTTSFTTTPITISTTTSATTNITSTRSNTCHYCKQVFKSAKFLQVHLYCDHQQQRSSSPNLVTDPQPQPQAPTI